MAGVGKETETFAEARGGNGRISREYYEVRNSRALGELFRAATGAGKAKEERRLLEEDQGGKAVWASFRISGRPNLGESSVTRIRGHQLSSQLCYMLAVRP